ncbi:hypothetical protein [Nostoc sp. DSM 114159]|jgi:hypothetical protein
MSEQEPPQKVTDSSSRKIEPTVMNTLITVSGTIIVCIITSVVAPLVIKQLSSPSQLASSNDQKDLTPDVSSKSNTLWSDQFLKPNGRHLLSSNGKYGLFCQDDGNLVLHKTSDSATIWESHTAGKVVTECYMQADGNFVVNGSDKKPLWASNTDNHPGAYLRVDNDGHVRIYKSNDSILWES